jgi:hypothetical protein
MNDHRISGDHDARYTVRSNNLSDLTSAATARSNLGLGTSSTANIATAVDAQAGTNNTTVLTPLRLREGLNATGAAPVYACRAWVNFNGTGTVAIRAAGNVSSITDNGVGNYTVNLATAMPDANYSATSNVGYTLSTSGASESGISGQTAHSVSIRSWDTVGAAFRDALGVFLAVHR